MRFTIPFIFLLFGVYNVYTQELFVKKTTDRDLITLDLYKDKLLKNSIFKYQTENRPLHHIKISAREDLVAFLEQGEVKNNVFRNSKLKILNESGRIIHVEDSVIDYNWSPDGNKIILSKGLIRREGFSDPEELVLLDFSDKIARISFKLSYYSPFNLNWVGKHIYFRSNDIKSNFKVIKFDPENIEYTITDLPSINISPDELYVAVSEYESSQYLNCDSRNNERLTCFKIYDIANKSFLNFYSQKSLGEPKSWVKSADHQFVFQQIETNLAKMNHIYDVTNNEIIESYEPLLLYNALLEPHLELYYCEK